MQIRLAVPTDAERIYAMRLWVGWDEDRVDEWFEDVAAGRRVMWMAEDAGQVAGMVALELVAHDPDLANGRDRAELGSLVVLPDFQRRGIGRALSLTVENEARRRGLAWLTLKTWEGNEEALPLYHALGYSEFKWVQETWGRAVCLRKPLTS